MQAIIDIIKELIHGQLGYFDRGDPGAYDWQAGNFTQDFAWHNLDLSGIVPADAKLVMIRVIVRSIAANQFLNFRTNGNSNVFNIERVPCNVAFIRYSCNVLVTPDVNRVVEYRVQAPGFDLINATVAGWWLR